MRKLVFVVLIILATSAVAQVKPPKPVTQAMLLNPPAEDWLMYSRTYDAQRYSPLKQITRQNVNQLKLAWTHELGTGTLESIPLVYRGVMYVIVPAGGVKALDAVNGAVIWEYKREGNVRPKTLAIYDDLIFYTG